MPIWEAVLESPAASCLGWLCGEVVRARNANFVTRRVSSFGVNGLAMAAAKRPSPPSRPPRAMIFRLASSSSVAAAARAWISALHLATCCSVARVLLLRPRILGLVFVGVVDIRGVIAAVENLGLGARLSLEEFAMKSWYITPRNCGGAPLPGRKSIGCWDSMLWRCCKIDEERTELWPPMENLEAGTCIAPKEFPTEPGWFTWCKWG